jgi:hypothetical protein
MADGGATAAMIMDLDALNAKQLVKEFKSAGKGIKSKDPILKAEALEKLSNVRYYTEGGALLPLVEQMIPKKVIEYFTDRQTIRQTFRTTILLCRFFVQLSPLVYFSVLCSLFSIPCSLLSFSFPHLSAFLISILTENDGQLQANIGCAPGIPWSAIIQPITYCTQRDTSAACGI